MSVNEVERRGGWRGEERSGDTWTSLKPAFSEIAYVKESDYRPDHAWAAQRPYITCPVITLSASCNFAECNKREECVLFYVYLGHTKHYIKKKSNSL
ncbi:hypothetical protein J6590_015702 [Homalodisca vitripennis]|nr:hypothetical protein J6590_015702 [Homalodisca vitripennis]